MPGATAAVIRSIAAVAALVAAIAPPARAETGPAPAIMTAMLQLYGRYNPAMHCWLATARDGPVPTQACLAIVQADRVAASDGERTYMLLAGPSRAGPVMAFVEFGGTHDLRVVAYSPPQHDGMPAAPDRITLQKLGASQWGWVADTPLPGRRRQKDASDYVVWLPRGAAIVPVYRFPHIAGGGTTVSDYRVDQADPDAVHYPLDIALSETKDRQPVGAPAVASFDQQHYTYHLEPAPP